MLQALKYTDHNNCHNDCHIRLNANLTLMLPITQKSDFIAVIPFSIIIFINKNNISQVSILLSI